jgi:hypothetical protein
MQCVTYTDYSCLLSGRYASISYPQLFIEVKPVLGNRAVPSCAAEPAQRYMDAAASENGTIPEVKRLILKHFSS